jgi:mRNA interferase MazF
MTDYDFGDVILVPFPFTDQTSAKKRPAVVVSSSAYNRERPDIVLVAISSQIRPSVVFGEVPVTLWKEAGLLKPSVVKPVFATIEKGLVFRKLGHLRKQDLKALQQALQEVLGRK